MEENKVVDEKKFNNHYKFLLDQHKNSTKESGDAVEQIAHNTPPEVGKAPSGPMNGDMMTWGNVLGDMDNVSSKISKMSDSENEDIMSAKVHTTSSGSNTELLDELNRIFTPVLIMQNLESDIQDKANAALSEATLLTEKSMIGFDAKDRMAQLIAICALLISKQKNSDQYKMYQKAAVIKRQMKLQIQKDEYDEAKALAATFLSKVANDSASSEARNAANKLLPEVR